MLLPHAQFDQDLRYPLRQLALGIGASSAIFTVVNSVLLRPIPYPESGRLIG